MKVEKTQKNRPETIDMTQKNEVVMRQAPKPKQAPKTEMIHIAGLAAELGLDEDGPQQAPQEALERPTRIVLKVEGGLLKNPQELKALSEYLHARQAKGEELLIVHGGKEQVEQWHRQQQSLLEGLWSTQGPLRQMQSSVMVLCGLLNTSLVSHLVADGHRALGLSGVDGELMKADFLNYEQLGRMGGPPRLRLQMLEDLLEQGVLPVLAPVGMGPDGLPVTLQEDLVAQVISVELGAQILTFVTAEPAILHEEASQISSVDVAALLRQTQIAESLIPKLHASLLALEGGVERVLLGDLAHLTQNDATEIHNH